MAKKQNPEDLIKQLKEENERLKSQLQTINSTPLLDRTITESAASATLNNAKKVSKIGYWNYSFTENRFTASVEFNEILEIDTTKSAASISTLRKLVHPNELSKIAELETEILQNHNNIEMVLHLVLKDGSSKYIEVKAKTDGFKDQKPNNAFGIIYDITDIHYKIEKLKQNQELFKNLFNHLTDIFIIFELVKTDDNHVVDYIYKDVNPAFEMLFETKKDDIINQPLSAQPQLFQQFNPHFKITAITGQPQQDRFFVQSLDLFMDVLIYAPSENTIATVWRNVSLMVQSEGALRESEEKYRQIFSIGFDGILMMDFFSGKIIEANQAACQMFGYKKDQFLTMNFRDLSVEPETIEQKITDEKLNQITGNLTKSDGSLLPFEASLSYFNWSGHKVVLISMRDISERIAAQKELINREKKYRQLFDYSNDAILIIKNYRIVDFNQKSIQLFGTTEHALENKTLWNLSPVSQSNGDDSRTKIVENLQQVLQGLQLQLDWFFQRDDKSLFIADLKLSPLIFENEKVVQAIVRDISPKKQIEETIAINEIRWKQALDISSTGFWEWNIITNEVFFSNVWKKMIGYEKDEIRNQFEEFEKRVHPDDITYVYDKINAYFTAQTLDFNIIFRIRCKNGSYKWINALGKILSYNIEGKPERFIGVHIDITKYIIEQQKAQEINTIYQEASHMLKIGYWKLNLKTMIISGSSETFNIFGINNSEKVSLKQIENLVHPEDQKHFISQFIYTEENQTRNYTFRIIVDNHTKFVLSNSNAFSDSKNRIEGFKGVFQDITSFKKQELHLKDEQKLINSYLEKTQQTIIIIQNQEIVFINEKFTELTGYSHTDHKASEIPLIDLASPEDRPLIQTLFNNVSENVKTTEKVDFRIETKFKRIKWVEMVIALIKFNGQNAILIIANDITPRKKIEIQLRETEDQHKKIISNATIGIAVINPNGKFQYANAEFIKTTGIDEKLLTKTELKQLLTDIDNFTVNNDIKSLKSKNSSKYKHELILKNNIAVHLKIEPSFDSGKNLEYLILYVENVDKVKKQIDLLTEESNTFKTIFENSNAGVGIFNNDEDLIIHNQLLFQIMNFDFLHKTTIGFSDFDFKLNNKSLDFTEITKTNRSISFEHHSSPNKTLYIEIKPIDLISSKAVLLITKDITPNKKEVMNLINQLEQFNTTFQKLPYGCALIDKNRNIVLCNPKYAEILHYSTNQLQHQKLDQLIHTDYLSDLITKYSELFSGVTPSFSQLNEMFTSEGKIRWINSRISTYTDQFNEIGYAIQVIDDVTEIKTAEYQILNNERLKTLNHIANSFAHDFNNMLMSMYGNSYLLKSNINDETLNSYADNLFTALQKASEQTRNLLSFSKYKSKIDLKTNTTKLFEDLLDQIYIPPNITIKASYDRRNENILADPSQLHRAIQNIIINACEFMPEGGELGIETKSVYFEKDPEKELPPLKKGKYLRISISDTGLGIASNNITKIFDPFFTTRKNSLNAGLGLTIASNIINEHGGTIKVESKLNRGSRFLIYLPQLDDEALRNNIQPDEQLIVKGTANLMIIDDEDVVRIITAELMKKLGYNVFSFASGKKAIRFYQSNMQNIDLVVLDKHMPEMDGIEVYKELRTLNPSIKAILLTGFNIDAEMEAVFLQDNNLIVQKPVSIEKLSGAISNLLLK